MVQAEPYDWPYDEVIVPARTALLVIDMQHDFCGCECLLQQDCTGATDEANHRAALNMIKIQGGVFGVVLTAQHFIAAMRLLVPA